MNEIKKKKKKSVVVLINNFRLYKNLNVSRLQSLTLLYGHAITNIVFEHER